MWLRYYYTEAQDASACMFTTPPDESILHYRLRRLFSSISVVLQLVSLCHVSRHTYPLPLLTLSMAHVDPDEKLPPRPRWCSPYTRGNQTLWRQERSRNQTNVGPKSHCWKSQEQEYRPSEVAIPDDANGTQDKLSLILNTVSGHANASGILFYCCTVMMKSYPEPWLWNTHQLRLAAVPQSEIMNHSFEVVTRSTEPHVLDRDHVPRHWDVFDPEKRFLLSVNGVWAQFNAGNYPIEANVLYVMFKGAFKSRKRLGPWCKIPTY